jgi:UDP-N-acetyl-D-glucosamine dehydrogenase
MEETRPATRKEPAARDRPETFHRLRARLEDGRAVVGIIGLGYVGLPLAVACARAGYRVLGFDVDPRKVERIGRGESYIRHLDGWELSDHVRERRIEATRDYDRLAEPDALLICVPTPLTPQRQPDLRFVVATTEEIARRLRPGQLVVLESTTYPGTTDEVLSKILGEGELELGRDYFLAYSPEREDPGNPHFTTRDIPKVVGGAEPASGELASLLYQAVVGRVVPMSGARAAEACKLTENIFRAVNIALVNELKVVYDRMGIDVWEVLDAAETKPFGFMRFDPGPGWGGHCIPLDPFYLSWKAREYGLTARFVELAGEVNVAMPAFVVEKLQRALNERSQAVRGSRVLLLGLAYKRDVDDPRESPAFELLDRLLELGAEVSYHDPHCPEVAELDLRSVPLDEALGAADLVAIVTAHREIDYERVVREAALVLDFRGVTRTIEAPNVLRL